MLKNLAKFMKKLGEKDISRCKVCLIAHVGNFDDEESPSSSLDDEEECSKKFWSSSSDDY